MVSLETVMCTLWAHPTVLFRTTVNFTWLVMAELGLCRVRKTITHFTAWSSKHVPQSGAEPAFEALSSVYDVCNTSSIALVRTVTPPTLSDMGTYRVEMQLCAPPAQPRTAEVTCCAQQTDQ